MYLSGRGLVGTADDRYAVGPGDARLIPAGVSHYFYNAELVGVAEVLGLYVGADSVQSSGYEFIAYVGDRDLERSARGSDEVVFPWVQIDAAPMVEAAGWEGTAYKMLLSSDVGAESFAASVGPGGGYEGEPTEDTIFFVWKGNCVVDGAPAGPRSIWLVRRGEYCSVRNRHLTETLTLYGFVMRHALAGPG